MKEKLETDPWKWEESPVPVTASRWSINQRTICDVYRIISVLNGVEGRIQVDLVIGEDLLL